MEGLSEAALRMKVFVLVVKTLAFILAIAVWCSVGLAMWIALVSRVTAIATLDITASLIGSAGQEKVSGATKSIEEAAAVWYRGVTSLVDSFYMSHSGNPSPDDGVKDVLELSRQEKERIERSLKEARRVKWERVAWETGYSVCFYGSVYLVYRFLW